MKYLLSLMAILLAFYYLHLIQRGNSRIVKLIYFELIYNLIIKFFIGNLGIPSVMNYLADVVWVWIIVEFLYQRKITKRRIPGSLIVCGGLFFLQTLASYLLNRYSPFLYLWGFRNNFRFILFAMMCAVYLRKRDIDTIMDILFGFFVLNILVTTYQYFFVSYSATAIGDFVSGLFSNGAERGGNASLNWLMFIVSTYEIVRYLNKVGSLKKMLFSIIGSMYMAALGEIKLFFIQIILVGVLAIAICRKSAKAVVFVLTGSVCLFWGIRFLYMAFPKFADFFTYQNMLEYVTKAEGYSSQGNGAGINRATVFSYVFERFLTDLPGRLHGVGLGNADFSSFSLLTSSFYRNYGWSGYTFFSSSFVLIETGILGLSLYLMYFANYVRYAIKRLRTDLTISKEGASVLHTTILVGGMCFFMIFSNQTLKMETSAYMVNCILAFPFVLYQKKDSSKVGESLIRMPSFRTRESKKEGKYET